MRVATEKMDERWVPFLREQLIDPQFQPAEIHKHILNLDQRIYLTPNLDGIFENYVQTVTGGTAIIKRHSDADAHQFLRDRNLYVVKVHGSLDAAHNLIFTRREYAEARIRYGAFYEALSACILSHTVLFLGCGIEDPDVALLLEKHNFSFPHSRPHYFVTSSKMPPDMRDSLRGNRNLKCLTYDPQNHHAELTESLAELVSRLEAERLSHPS